MVRESVLGIPLWYAASITASRRSPPVNCVHNLDETEALDGPWLCMGDKVLYVRDHGVRETEERVPEHHHRIHDCI